MQFVFPIFQTAMKDREKHKIALAAYKKHVKEIEDWYDEMKVRQATTPQATDSVAELKQQLLENKVNRYQTQAMDSFAREAAGSKMFFISLSVKGKNLLLRSSFWSRPHFLREWCARQQTESQLFPFVKVV